MGKIKSMDATQTGNRKVVPVVLALTLALPFAGAEAVSAQETPSGGFSLPAGAPPQQQPPSDVQGPVDAESPPPRRTDEPAQTSPSPSLPSIAPVPVPTPQQRQRDAASQRAETPRTQREPRQTSPAPAQAEPAAPQALGQQSQDDATDIPVDAPAALPLPAPAIPDDTQPGAVPELDADNEPADGSIWWWLGAGLIALVSLIAMALRQRSSARAEAAAPPVPAVPTVTVPTPPLRTPPPVPQPSAQPAAQAFSRPAPQPSGQSSGQPVPQPAPRPAPLPASAPFGTLQGGGFAFGASAAPAPAPAPARPVAAEPSKPPAPAPQAPPAPAPETSSVAASVAQPPRLLLDFTTLGVDVTLVNAIARYHLGITNMSDITVSEVALHGAVVQARRGMPPTIDPLRGDVLLPKLQTLEDIAADATRRCEGQIRLPLEQIEPIEMQGRLLFVPVVHIWIGYTGPDGTRYAVTQSFVIGEESSPPGPRVGPLRLDLGPRRFTEVGQRPLQPA
jgi:hypothetical protein